MNSEIEISIDCQLFIGDSIFEKRSANSRIRFNAVPAKNSTLRFDGFTSLTAKKRMLFSFAEKWEKSRSRPQNAWRRKFINININLLKSMFIIYRHMRRQPNVEWMDR